MSNDIKNIKRATGTNGVGTGESARKAPKSAGSGLGEDKVTAMGKNQEAAAQRLADMARQHSQAISEYNYKGPLSRDQYEQLLNAGVDPGTIERLSDVNDRIFDGGGTLLHEAARYGVYSVEGLLGAGLDPFITNDNEKTPLEIAQAFGNDDQISLLGQAKRGS